MPDSDVITRLGLDDGVFDDYRAGGHFRRDGPPVNKVLPELPQWQSQPMTTGEDGLSSGTDGQRHMRCHHGRFVSWRGRAGLAQWKRI
jgi:hypothetical protein